jgi:hypothetical protein
LVIELPHAPAAVGMKNNDACGTDLAAVNPTTDDELSVIALRDCCNGDETDKRYGECSNERVHAPNENKMSDGGRGRALLGAKVRKSSQKWSVRRSAVRSIAWLGLCGFIGGRGTTIGAQLHNKFFAIIANAHILSCKLESAFL